MLRIIQNHHGWSFSPTLRGSKRGFLLVQSLIIVFIVAGVAGALLTISTSGTRREQSRNFKFKSRQIAEAGLDLSLNTLRQATDGKDNDDDGLIDEGMKSANIFDPAVVALLEGNLGRIGTVNWSLINDLNGNGLPDFGEPGVVTSPLSGGEYFTYSIFSENDGLDNDNDGTTDEIDEAGFLSILARSRYNDYESRIRFTGILVEKWYESSPPTWCASDAFASGGSLTVTGNCSVYGAKGNVHCNGFLDLGGSSSITGNATSTDGGNVDPANVDGTVDLAADSMPIPDVSLNNVQALRDQAILDAMDVYYLKNNGTVYKNGVLVSPGGTYHGWSMGAAGSWTLSGNKGDLDGLFYTVGDVFLGGNKTHVDMTIISEGNISLNGNGDYGSYYNNLFLVSLKDILLSGTPQETGDLGAILAREQIKAVGNTFVRGTIMAADLDDASPFVTETSVEGTFDVEYNGGFETKFPVFNPDDFKFKFEPVFSGYEER